jgi:hypothetical protein
VVQCSGATQLGPLRHLRAVLESHRAEVLDGPTHLRGATLLLHTGDGLCDDGDMEPPTTDSGNGQEFSVSGVVLMKGHPHHPAVHHHGLGELSVTSGRVKLLTYRSDEELAQSPAERVTLGTSSTLEEFGSMLFVDFGDESVPRDEVQWAVDFGTVNEVERLLHPDGTVNHEKLVEYQVLLSVEDVEAGIRYRQQFVDAVTALGGHYEDESTLFERLLAKWPYWA